MAKVTYDLGEMEDSDISLSEVELKKVAAPLPLPNQSQIRRWQVALSASPWAMSEIQRRYGLTSGTIETFELGLMDRPSGPWITIPVRDGQGKLLNVRSRYVGRSAKILKTSKYSNWRGHGAPALYPVHPFWQLPPPGSDLLIVCGMFDALVAIQADVPAVTWTGGVNVPWPEDWEDIAKHWNVTVLLDRGEEAYADRLAAKLGCKAIHLPAHYRPKTDLADLFTQHNWNRQRLAAFLGEEMT